MYEAFTFAALLKAPVLFLLEHNGYAQSTDTRGTTPGDILKRAEGFGLEADLVEDGDPEKLWERLRDAVAHVRQGNPLLQVIKTRRLCAHSKGDDSRPRELVDELWRYDPFEIALRDSAQVRVWYEEAREEMRQVTADVDRREPQPFHPFDPMAPGSRPERNSGQLRAGTATTSTARVVEGLNRALTAMMAEHPDVVLVGEDLKDPYGGAFKVTRGLSTQFPSRVFSTPISEAAIVGVSNGLALAGMRPIAEIMFADFATLAADQIVNQAAKYFSMYAGQITCPVKVRLVSGGYRGYGPTHSQSLEALYCGIPGLRVVALSERHDPGGLMTSVVLEDENPVIFVENKVIYAKPPVTQDPPGMSFRDLTGSQGNFPPLHYVPEEQVAASVTVVTYGGTVALVEEAITQCTFEKEMFCEYFILTQLWPLEVGEIVRSVERTRRLVIVEEGTAEFGVGAAVVAQVARQLGGRIPFACECVGARAESIPSAKHLEEQVLPSKERIVEALDLVHGRSVEMTQEHGA